MQIWNADPLKRHPDPGVSLSRHPDPDLSVGRRISTVEILRVVRLRMTKDGPQNDGNGYLRSRPARQGYAQALQAGQRERSAVFVPFKTMKLSKYKLLASQYLALRLRSGQVIPEGLSFESPEGVSFGTKETPFYTYQNTNALLLKYPLLDYFGKPWGNRLTLLSFNIPEAQRKKRDRLRYNLMILGFGKINRSLYITPHLTVKEVGHLVTSSEFSGGASEGVSFGTKETPFGTPFKTIAFSVPFESFSSPEGVSLGARSRHPEPFGAKDLVPNLSPFWDLTKVADLYERAVAFWETVPHSRSRHPEPGVSLSRHPDPDSSREKDLNSRDPSGRTSQDDGRTGMTGGVVEERYLSKFFDAFFVDPFLPVPLLPKDWIGSRALAVAKGILEY